MTTTEEIVVGACYRLRPKTAETVHSFMGVEHAYVRPNDTVRVTKREGGLVTWLGLDGAHGGALSEERWLSYNPVRVPDPTPAVIDDEPPLAGEMTLRQLEAWREVHGIDEMSVIYVGRTGLWHACAERNGIVVGQASSNDPQDAITALMDKVHP